MPLFCPKCDTFSPTQDALFCYIDGTKLENREVVRCPQCNHVVDMQFDRYCEMCGSKLPETAKVSR